MAQSSVKALGAGNEMVNISRERSGSLARTGMLSRAITEVLKLSSRHGKRGGNRRRKAAPFDVATH